MKLREPELTNPEVAKRLGISPKALNTYICKAVSEGWLTFEDALDRTEYEIIPLINENIVHFLKQRDKMVTVEAAKNTIWKTYQASKGVTEGAQTVLALKIEYPENKEQPVITGQIMGKPRNIEGE